MKLSCSAKKKQPPPDPSPEAGRGRPRGTGRQTLQNLPNPQTPFKTLQTLQNPPNPPNTSPTGTPGPRPLLNQAPRAKATAMAFYWLSKLPFASPQTLQTLQNPPNAPNTIQNPPNPPGLEACFEQVAQGLWLVRRVHRRSKTISLPGRLELPTLRLTASRSNQLSYGSLCRRPKLVPVLEKRLNNSWLQMVCQTKGQQPK